MELISRRGFLAGSVWANEDRERMGEVISAA
jgi:hypothetical protein